MRSSFSRGRRRCRFFRFGLAFFGPDPLCRIGLLPLNFRHLAERMSFARDAKQQDAERNSTEAVAEEKSHNALAQLSASLVTCKLKPRVAQDFDRFSPLAAAAVNSISTRELLQKIERRCSGITIRRGGSHGQTQRLERSFRSRSAFFGNSFVFCADFVHAEGCTFLGLVQPHFAGESPCPEFYWSGRRNCRGNLLSIHWRGVVPFGRNSAGLRRHKTILSRFAGHTPAALDRSIHHIGCLFAACAAVSFAGMALGFQHPGTGWLDRIRLC